MATTRNILVPIDYSKRSQPALHHAIGLARDLRAKLLLVHVITAPAAMVPLQFRERYYKDLEREAAQSIQKLLRRQKIKDKSYRLVILRGADAARLIAEQAKKSRSAMIVMGSHGRTGLHRLILGSVAEKTLRYTQCPVLIVKR